jgi:hypothetical protein
LLLVFMLAARIVSLVMGNGADPLHGASGESQIRTGDPMLLSVLAVLATTGTAVMTSLWLCFFPPQSYARWIRAGYTQEQASS